MSGLHSDEPDHIHIHQAVIALTQQGRSESSRQATSLARDKMQVQMFDKENHVRSAMQVDENGISSMKLYDKTEKVVWQAP